MPELAVEIVAFSRQALRLADWRWERLRNAGGSVHRVCSQPLDALKRLRNHANQLRRVVRLRHVRLKPGAEAPLVVFRRTVGGRAEVRMSSES